MISHRDDFQSEVHDEALARAVAEDYRTAALSAPDRALCDYAVKSTREPWTIKPADLDALRQPGLDDTAIHDATQVIAFFNYINRIADCLGVDPEP